MGSIAARSAFDQLAAEYLEDKEVHLARLNISEETKAKERKKAQDRVAELRKEHRYALDTYYRGSDAHRGVKKAFKNDIGG